MFAYPFRLHSNFLTFLVFSFSDSLMLSLYIFLDSVIKIQNGGNKLGIDCNYKNLFSFLDSWKVYQVLPVFRKLMTWKKGWLFSILSVYDQLLFTLFL